MSACEFFIEFNTFKFYNKPYYLSLTLPGEVIHDDRLKAEYDLEKAELKVSVAKLHRGTEFTDLDMPALLLGLNLNPNANVSDTSSEIDKSEIIDLTHVRPEDSLEQIENSNEELILSLMSRNENKPHDKKPLIEEISEASADDIQIQIKEDEVIEEENEENSMEWTFPQTIPAPYDETPTHNISYGFLDQYHGFFNNTQIEINEIMDITDPDNIPEVMRHPLRLQKEKSDFSIDHYLADFMDTTNIESILEYKPIWKQEYIQLLHYSQESQSIKSDMKPDELAVPWTNEHRDSLMKLPRKHFMTIDSEDFSLILGLIDLMYCYCYNLRTMEGEYSVESSWTISKISATLSWLSKYDSIEHVLVTCVRRALCYPLYRNWKVALIILEDLATIFALGKRAILRALIEIKKVFDTHDAKHYLSRLWIEDYCIWIQSVNRSKLTSLSKDIAQVSKLITKDDIGFPLIEIESLALEDQFGMEAD